jgi:mRNA interferase YafQ
MLKSNFTRRFKKDIDRMEKRGKNLSKMFTTLDMLIKETPLPAGYDDHPLHGELKNVRCCHIEGDWLLLYKRNDEAKTLSLTGTGSHSDLF